MDVGTRCFLVTAALGWLGTGLLQALVRGPANVDETKFGQTCTHWRLRLPGFGETLFDGGDPCS